MSGQSMHAFDLGELLGERVERKSPPAMAADLLVEYRERYQDFLAGCRFRPGDLVTPLANSITVGAGEPCVVLELRTSTPVFEGNPDYVRYGQRFDMRIARFMEDSIARFWVESVDYEPYSGGNS